MDKLAVVINNVHDQHSITRVLASRNYQLFSQLEWLYKCNREFAAIIICHRKSQQAPLPALPPSHPNSRIIVLSDQTEENIIVDTLNAGAHHYIARCNSERVLQARIDAALRVHSQQDSLVLEVDPYLFKVDCRTAYYGERMINLTPREFQLAYYLFSNKDRVVSDSELMTSVWTLPPNLDTRRIDTLIYRIKKKMNLNTDQSKWKIDRSFKKGYTVRC